MVFEFTWYISKSCGYKPAWEKECEKDKDGSGGMDMYIMKS